MMSDSFAGALKLQKSSILQSSCAFALDTCNSWPVLPPALYAAMIQNCYNVLIAYSQRLDFVSLFVLERVRKKTQQRYWNRLIGI